MGPAALVNLAHLRTIDVTNANIEMVPFQLLQSKHMVIVGLSGNPAASRLSFARQNVSDLSPALPLLQSLAGELLELNVSGNQLSSLQVLEDLYTSSSQGRLRLR